MRNLVRFFAVLVIALMVQPLGLSMVYTPFWCISGWLGDYIRYHATMKTLQINYAMIAVTFLWMLSVPAFMVVWMAAGDWLHNTILRLQGPAELKTLAIAVSVYLRLLLLHQILFGLMGDTFFRFGRDLSAQILVVLFLGVEVITFFASFRSPQKTT